MKIAPLIAVGVAPLLTAEVRGQATVAPSDRVVTGVSTRAPATTNSAKVWLLLPGESGQFRGEVPTWYRIDHPDHGEGFVFKSWTEAITHSDDGAQSEFDVYVVDVATTGLTIYVHGQGFNLVYDARSNDDLSGNRFVDFLNEVVPGTTTIDHLLISHAHRDTYP